MERKAGVGEKGLRKTKGGETLNEAGQEPVYDEPKVKEAKGPTPAPRGAAPDTSVAVEFKDDVRRIDFKMGAIEAIESHYPNKETGNPTTPISVILRWQQGGFGMSWSQLKVFLWAGMLWETPHIQLGELDDMMDLSKVKYYSTQVDKGLQLAFGISDADIAAANKAIADGNTKAAQKNGPLIGPS